jgi:hypothetical protein
MGYNPTIKLKRPDFVADKLQGKSSSPLQYKRAL